MPRGIAQKLSAINEIPAQQDTSANAGIAPSFQSLPGIRHGTPVTFAKKMKSVVFIILVLLAGCSSFPSNPPSGWQRDTVVISIRETPDAPQTAELWSGLFHDSTPTTLDLLYIDVKWVVPVSVDSPENLKSENLSLLLPATFSKDQLVAKGWAVPGARFRLTVWRKVPPEYMNDIFFENIEKAEKLGEQATTGNAGKESLPAAEPEARRP